MILRAVPEQMAMHMTFFATKRNVFIVDGLDPLKVFVPETYRVRERFCKMHIDTDPSIGSVSIVFGFFSNFDESSEAVHDLLECDLFLVFLRQGIKSDPDRCPIEIFFVRVESFHPIPQKEPCCIE